MNKTHAKELKKLVKDFRHNDLRLLMSYFKRNSKGKKVDLMERVNEMIDNYVDTNNSYSATMAIKIYEISKKLSVKAYNGLACSSALNTKSSKPKCSVPMSNLKFKSTDKPYSSHYCPDVTFKSLPFYDFIAELMKPTAVINSSSELNMTQCAKYVFSLTPAQVKQIKESEVLSNDCVLEYQQQVLLRFCLMEVTSDQDDNYPQNLVVHVNQKSITLPSYNMPTNAGVQPKRPSRPLDITFACILNPVNMNNIHLTWSADPIHKHCFSVILAKRLNCQLMLKRLRQNCYRHPDHTRALVKEKLAASLDSEISFTCLKISLLCPLSKMKMKVPIRSVNCNHLQCFDAGTFVQMNEKKPTWSCPICDKATRYDSLIVDGLFLEILDQAPSATEIQFLEDGSWKDIRKKSVESKVALETSVLCYEIADSPESGGSKETIVLESKDDPQVSAAPADSSIIDLTGDSDDEGAASPSYEATVDSTDYLSSASSSSAPFDLSKGKRNENLVDSIFNCDIPFLHTPLPPLSSDNYLLNPPDLDLM